MLFACLVVPNFPVQAVLRAEPEEVRQVLAQKPVAIVDGPESMQRVSACNQEAQSAGIEIGMTKVQAEHCPGAVIRKRSSEQEQANQAALFDCAFQFSPRVESIVQGVVTLDITGTQKIFGSPQELDRKLVQTAAQIGFQVNAAIATNPDTALIAAKGFTGITVIPEGNEAERLACLPVDVLSPTAEQSEILDGWGIRKCRDLALLPPVPLVERLGQAGLHLQKLARGEVKRVLVPAEPKMKFEENIELEDAVTELEPLAFVLNRLLENLGARLVSRALATDELHLQLKVEVLSDRDLSSNALPEKQQYETFVRALKLPVPMQNAKILLKLLQLDLAAHNPSAPVKAISLEAKPARPRQSQSGLFAPPAPEPEKLELTLARMSAVVGEQDHIGRNRVGLPVVLDSHKPDNFLVKPFLAPDSKKSVSVQPDIPSSLLLNVFRPPLAASVDCSKGVPCRVRFDSKNASVINAAGPTKLSGSWWNSSEEWAREQWDVALQIEEAAGVYQLYRDVKTGAWFVEGIYD